jgi:hypothetical protein
VVTNFKAIAVIRWLIKKEAGLITKVCPTAGQMFQLRLELSGKAVEEHNIRQKLLRNCR